MTIGCSPTHFWPLVSSPSRFTQWEDFPQKWSSAMWQSLSHGHSWSRKFLLKCAWLAPSIIILRKPILGMHLKGKSRVINFDFFFRINVSDICLAYKVGHLTEVCEELADAKDSRDAAKDHNDRHPEERLLMKPVACSRHFSCLCCSVDKVRLILWQI